ncbi:hypothetical protein C0J52_17568 [Blattella germanica]|nr:hypothetical protein C0J52_17568 [Blattella germanica]
MPRIFQATCEIDITCVSMRFVMSYVGDCGFNIEGEHSDGCKCCGFMSETYQDSENTIPIYRNRFGASAGMDRFLENSPKEKSTSWADNIDAVCPDWLRDELKRLFPETVRPPPVYSDPDSLNSSSSRDSRLPTMTFTNSETRPSCSDSLPLSLEKGIAGIQLDVDYSQVQVPPWLKKGNNKPVQFQRAANMVQEDFPPINQANIKYSISPNEVNSLTPITLSISKELNMDPLTCKSIYEWDKTLRGNGSMASMSDNPKPAPQQTGCTFCEKNGETDVMVKSHNLYNPLTKLVECPILRAYRCEICQATGDLAHTRSYCPRLRMVQGKVRSATVALKSTKRQANGSLRNVNKVSKVRL